MQENRISIQITPAEVQSVKDAISNINGVLSKYLIAITTEARKARPRNTNLK